jgi:hypothetical protein
MPVFLEALRQALVASGNDAIGAGIVGDPVLVQAFQDALGAVEQGWRASVSITGLDVDTALQWAIDSTEPTEGAME